MRPLDRAALDQGQARRGDRRHGGGHRRGAGARPRAPGSRSAWRVLVAAVLGLAMVQFLARGMTSPLRDMAAAASAMARGDYDRRVHATSRDEVGELARAFNAMAADLADVERMRRDLVANVSHELRTPIGALQALLENLADGVEPTDPAALRTALAQTERLGRLVEQLLDLSRLESGGLALEPVVLRRPRAARAGDARVRARRPPGAAEGLRAARRPARHGRPGADAPGRREPARQRGPPLAARRPRVAERARGRRPHADRGRRRGPGHRAARGGAGLRALLPRRRGPQRRRAAASAWPSRAGSSTPTAARSAPRRAR